MMVATNVSACCPASMVRIHCSGVQHARMFGGLCIALRLMSPSVSLRVLHSSRPGGWKMKITHRTLTLWPADTLTRWGHKHVYCLLCYHWKLALLPVYIYIYIFIYIYIYLYQYQSVANIMLSFSYHLYR